jgi:hypothetical protein
MSSDAPTGIVDTIETTYPSAPFITTTPACGEIPTAVTDTGLARKSSVRDFRDHFSGRGLRYFCNPRCFKSHAQIRRTNAVRIQPAELNLTNAHHLHAIDIDYRWHIINQFPRTVTTIYS